METRPPQAAHPAPHREGDYSEDPAQALRQVDSVGHHEASPTRCSHFFAAAAAAAREGA